MHIDPAILSAVSALLGALIGGGASLAAAVYTQRMQDRLQRFGREATKREQVYAEFILTAAKALVRAYTTDGLAADGEEQRLIGLVNRMRLFAPPKVIDEAEAVIEGIFRIALEPSLDLGRITLDEVTERRKANLLLPLSIACRADLDELYRST
jgi:hypothetical protein